MHRTSGWVAASLVMSMIVWGTRDAAPALATRAAPHAGSRPAIGTTAVELRLWLLLNADRAAAGVPPLALSMPLSRVARGHSMDMALQHYFAHSTPRGVTFVQRIRAAGISYRHAGENLGWAAGYGPPQATAILNAQMMAEPTSQENHRHIILDRVLGHVGIGIVVADDGRVYLTEDFTN